MNPVRNNNNNNNSPPQPQSLPPDAGLVDTICAAALSTWANAEVSCHRVTSFLIMSLLALGRTQDVLKIASTICNPSNASCLDRLRPDAFDALNSTLASANLPTRPVSAKRQEITNEIAARREAREASAAQQEQQVGGSGDSNADPWTQQQKQQKPTTTATTTASSSSSSSSGNLIPPQVSEKMLEYGRTRNWTEALSLLHSLNLSQHASIFGRVALMSSSSESQTSTPPQSQAATAQQIGLANSVTLLYNCAISAAVDQPETVDQLVAEMKELETGDAARRELLLRCAVRAGQALAVAAGVDGLQRSEEAAGNDEADDGRVRTAHPGDAQGQLGADSSRVPGHGENPRRGERARSCRQSRFEIVGRRWEVE
ncbi:unnamed protein product [Rotaria socialis]|uniref:Uncharacterized protein n=1 Tax=Rotaria socialis TaxID=392032 RepID=A0A819A3P8_9BILA|nr:unnamed protein product [Rotaria socialis]CAF4859663.1 unnamed protein product [Rotaria socialis]